MPVVRIDIPDGHARSSVLALKGRIEDAVARTWAKEHIYVAVREYPSDAGDRTAMMTVDLRPGRGHEEERSAALYHQAVAALQDLAGTDPKRFVLLVREFPERCFVVAGGERLPPLAQITPALE